jgi:hypothetical protein
LLSLHLALVVAAAPLGHRLGNQWPIAESWEDEVRSDNSTFGHRLDGHPPISPNVGDCSEPNVGQRQHGTEDISATASDADPAQDDTFAGSNNAAAAQDAAGDDGRGHHGSSRRGRGLEKLSPRNC